MTAIDLSQVFYKITNATENHYGFQYKDGLNVLIGRFNSNPDDSCCAGGLYFTDAKNIFKFIGYGCNVREITLPITDPDFQIVKDLEGDKWRANKIILGKKYDLWELETIKMLTENGANIHEMCNLTSNNTLIMASQRGHTEIVKYLVEKDVDIHVHWEKALKLASANGHFEIVKCLVEKGADIHADNDFPLRSASENGNFEIVKYLVEKGANIRAEGSYAMKLAHMNGRKEIVKFLMEKFLMEKS